VNGDDVKRNGVRCRDAECDGDAIGEASPMRVNTGVEDEGNDR
jgi:hypothetical protein